MNHVDLDAYPIKPVLKVLLSDKTTQENIIFATDGYEDIGEEYSAKKQITLDKLLNPSFVLQRRIDKSNTQQQDRTKANAEVMTPAWVINKMVSHADEEWFGRADVFNRQNADHTWTTEEEKIIFPENKTWQDYVMDTRLEITCGEAPYLASRYDTVSGEYISVERRIGLLDRKLRVVSENNDSEDDDDDDDDLENIADEEDEDDEDDNL